MSDLEKFIISVGIALVILITQQLLSKCESWILGSILPIASLIFIIEMFYSGKIQFNARNLLLFGVLIATQLYIWREGRKKVKEKKNLELNKMIIKDLY